MLPLYSKLLLKVQLKSEEGVKEYSEEKGGGGYPCSSPAARGLSSHYAESRAERDNETMSAMSAMSQFQFLVAFAACESRASRIYCAPNWQGGRGWHKEQKGSRWSGLS